MNILLTSGGTRVPIDRVRHIGNMSRGTFPSKIAYEMLMAAHRIASPRRSIIDSLIFAFAKDSRRPFQLDVDLDDPDYDFKETIRLLMQLDNDYHVAARGILEQMSFRNFEQYAHGLNNMLVGQPDLVVLAAAVSDFLVENYVDGKVRSKNALSIALTPAEKLIGSVKQKLPTCKLVGFKLLVDSTDEDLIAAARQSIVDNGCDLVVANDLRDIQNDDHRVFLVTPESTSLYQTDRSDPNYLARVVATKAMALVDERVEAP